MSTGVKFRSCCGTNICSGCILGMYKQDITQKCPFCRAENVNEVESTERIRRLVLLDNVNALFLMGVRCELGIYGVERNEEEAMIFYCAAAERGSAKAHNNLGNIFMSGERDVTRATYHYEQAAIGGYATARYNLGAMEVTIGNYHRGSKHFMIAACAGKKEALEALATLKNDGRATEAMLECSNTAYRAYLGTIKSSKRDEAAHADDDFVYY